MAAPATEHVRNIVLVGQDGAGKTSLAEAMLHVSGKTPRMGTTHDGKSYLDYDEEEIRRQLRPFLTRITRSICLIPRVSLIFLEIRFQLCRRQKWPCSLSMPLTVLRL